MPELLLRVDRASSSHRASPSDSSGMGRSNRSYLAWRKLSGVLELSDTEQDLISQIKDTAGERLAAIEVRHLRPECIPREITVC